MADNLNCAIIFGGSGFIGTFFANFLLDRKLCSHVYLCDIEPIEKKSSDYRKKSILSWREKVVSLMKMKNFQNSRQS